MRLSGASRLDLFRTAQQCQHACARMCCARAPQRERDAALAAPIPVGRGIKRAAAAHGRQRAQPRHLHRRLHVVQEVRNLETLSPTVSSSIGSNVTLDPVHRQPVYYQGRP